MKQTVLILGKIWPEPASSAAGSRMLQLIHIFLAKHWTVTFATAANDSEFMADLQSIGVTPARIELNNTSFDSFVKELQPTLVLFDRFTTEEQFGWRVAEHCPDAVRILDTEDLHCLRAGRHKALKDDRPFTSSDLINDIAKREIASIFRCDLSLIISHVEMDILQNVFNVDPALLLYIPFLLDTITEEIEKEWSAFSQRHGFISIGNFLHEPNWDAVLFLKKEIWPLIRKQLPKAEVHIYGAYPSHKVFELHKPKEGFLIKGRAENVATVMSEARVCIAPLRFGAGIKGKLSDAMLYGTPSVTTTIGAESMHGDLPWNGSIADSPAELALAAVSLYTNEALWEQARQNGRKIINTLYNKDLYQHTFVDIILAIQKNLAAHRQKNFTGSMLMQHTTSSSRYMALWIETKNKIR